MDAGPRTRSPWFVIACATALLGSCGGESAPTDAQDPLPTQEVVEWEVATSRAGRYQVSWRPVGGPIPLNELFELEVRVASATDATPVTNAKVHVIAEMPEHGHGMNREPRAHEEGDGAYRVKGMLMHMTGRWVLSIDVIVSNVSESTDYEVVLE